jgi:probable rRNA maturation factor
MIHYFSENIPLPKLPKRVLTAWIKKITAQHKRVVGNVAYIFCDDARILEINRKYLQHDYFTDIITFEDNDGILIGGDIFISLDTVKTNADEYNVSFQNELYRVIIHGILHLCGQDDQTQEDQATMTQLENEALKLLDEKQTALND